MSYLVFDIETVKESMIRSAWEERELNKGNDIQHKFPPPITHKLVTLSYAVLNNKYEMEFIITTHTDTTHTEAQKEEVILKNFSEYIENDKSHLVSWNGRRFDMPVIVYRCLKYGIPIEWYYANSNYRYRFSIDGHFDMADYITDYYANEVPNLDFMAKLLGLPGKIKNTGSDVQKLYNDGKTHEIASYCTLDVLETYFVFLGILLLKGNINKEEHNNLIIKFKHFLKNPVGSLPFVKNACNQLIERWS